MSLNNQLRSLDRLINIEGWFIETHDDGKYSMHLDVVFDEARLGGDEDSEVRFRLKVKRCLVVVEIPDQDLISYDKTSVDRTPPLQAEITRVLKEATEAEVGARANVGVSDWAASLNGLMKRSRTLEETSSESGVIPVISATHQASKGGQVSWKLVPEIGDTLEGPVWNATDEPRMILVDKRSAEQKEKDASRGLPPNVAVKICCKREDISIADIEMKDREKQGILKLKARQSTRVAAAEGYLKQVMYEQGLSAGDLSEAFSDVVLADYYLPIEL